MWLADSILSVAFGDNYDRPILDSILTQWNNGDFSNLPTFEVISSAILGNANGGYSQQTNTIYLADNFVNNALPYTIDGVILEEIGHYIDAQINTVDSAGDEGAIFSALVQGKTLSEDTLTQLKAEDDSATIIIDGEERAIEMATGPRMVFAASDGINGTELWITDGTTSSLLKDINPGSVASNPGNFIALSNGNVLFSATDVTNGTEMWITDGTTNGTNLIMDIRSGSANAIGFSTNFKALSNGKALFTANDGINGNELWITDGTAAGTSMLKEINPTTGVIGSDPKGLTALGVDKFLFQANDGTNGLELWITDGTTAGTTLVKNISATGDSSPTNFFSLGDGRALFSANNGTANFELWITNGTSAGTSLLKEINTGGSSSPANFSKLADGRVVFTAWDGSATGQHGTEPWITNLTTAGTTLLKDISSGITDSNSSNFTALNGKVLFSAQDITYGLELWITDGTTTQLLKDIRPGAISSTLANFTDLGNGKMVFSAHEDTNGIELWVTDGTDTGTTLVKDINPGTANSSPKNFTILGNGKALFQSTNAANAAELWITDGTAAGTQLVTDINTLSASSSPANFFVLNGKLLFSATDGYTGSELFISDGTAAGTTQLMDINPGTASGSPTNFISLGNGKALFTATTAAAGNELWLTDGTAAGTSLLTDINLGTSGSNASNFFALGNGKVVFSASDGTVAGVGHGTELYISDGTSAGTHLLQDINSGTASSSPANFFSLGNGSAVFKATDVTNGTELWVTDGSTASLVKNINTGTANAFTTPNFALLNTGTALFAANDGTNGTELWITNGTTAGTTLVKNIYTGGLSSSPQLLFSLGNGKVLFNAGDSTNGTEPWITDGTAGGTVLLKNIKPGTGNSNPNKFTLLTPGRAIFTADDGVVGIELWVTDGTAAGTQLLMDTTPGVFDASIQNLTPLGNGKMLFTNNSNSTYGAELWVTDGTAAGTSVQDLNPGTNSSTPSSLTALGNGSALFSANDGVNGTELWISDGTTAGTLLLKDINPGSGNSSPSNFRLLGDGRVLFSATDATHGAELWITDGTATGTMLVQDINSTTASSTPSVGAILSGSAPSNTAPTDLSLSANTITENTVIGTGLKIGNITITDPDTTGNNNVLTVEGTDAGNFEIRNSTELFYIGASPDFETKTSYSINLKSSDGALTYSEAFSVNVSNVNETPTDLTLSATTVNENVAADTDIGTFSTTDPDTGNTFTYSLVSGTGSTDNSSFTIVSNQLQINNSPDFETKSSYNIRVGTTDQGSLTFEKQLTIGINDVNENVNETPTDLTLSATTVNENVAANTVVGTFSTTDPDTGNTFTYSLVSGTGSTDNSSFTIVNNQLQINNSPDFETKSSYNIRVGTTDQGSLTFEKTLTIGINNVNEAPVITSGQSYSLNENTKNGTVVGTVLATDVENNSLASWAITNGNNLNGFAINATTGVITVNNTAALDFETNPLFNLTLTVSDGTNTSIAQTIAINLNNLTEFPYTAGVDVASGTSGNDYADLLAGNDSFNAGGGDDIVDGGDGDDSILGGTGNDILDGGSGNDRLLGGDGNDTYIIDSIRDVVIENASEGQDIVKSVVNHTLTANLEDLILTGSGNITGTGNGLDNLITGNSGNNLLKGLGGQDILLGEGGNDTLIGGAGDDLLTGGAGVDRFLFGSGAVFNTSAFGVDTITDLTSGSDQIALSKTSFAAIASAIGGNLQTSEFALINDDNLAGSSSAKIIYNPATGNLFYNQNGVTDGLGSGGLFATLNGNLNANDVLIQA